MKNESLQRRGYIADSFCELAKSGHVRALVLDAGRGPGSEIQRRDLALRALIEHLEPLGSSHLVIDMDRTLMARDAKSIQAATRSLQSIPLTYSHQTLANQPLLAIPDAVAWCWARGGVWRRRVEPIINKVIVL